MCGIAGVFSREPVEPSVVERMLGKIGYRGPDHVEVKQWRSPAGVHLAVGQARLAIIDLSPEANQPFTSEDGQSSITFNGEFYNFQALKQALVEAGESFHTSSDTEVALRLLDREGGEALSRLWGMFAGAYYRNREGKLLLFRDRFGKKPLYVYPHGGRVYFASEPKAILEVLDHTPEPDDAALLRYFYLGYAPTDACVYRGMFKIPEGSLLELDAAMQPSIRPWFRPQDEPAAPEEDLESLFLDAVRLRMIADVPLAAFLSGGLDSSLVVAAMTRVGSRPVHTFSVRFDGPQALDESKYARLVAAHFGSEHEETTLGVDALKAALPEVLAHFDEPFADSSAVPMLLVSRAARRHFTVALSGDGADEIFAGYRKYLAEGYLRKLGPRALRRMWKPLLGLAPTGRANRWLELSRRARRLLRADAATAAQRHVRLLRMSPVDEEPLLGPRLANLGFADYERELAARLPDDADLNDCLRFDQKLVLQDDMFVKVDRMSMMASLEVRSPFVDHRLARLANALPPARKLNGGFRKRVLVERLGHMLPPEILNRPKTGFEMPLGAWLRGDLRSWTEHMLFHEADTAEWVDAAALRQVWRVHRDGKLDCTETIWRHIVFAAWLKGARP